MTKQKINEVAKKHFGYDSLRPGQAAPIAALLKGRDTMVIQHTGAGKSAVYKIAGAMIEGVTVIVSPLIALQKDQVDGINVQDAPEAVQINSMQTASANRETLRRVKEGVVEYVFLAPEQLSKPETMSELEQAGVSLFVVDEAHCVVEWGHDFRPDYLKIGSAIEQLGHPPVLALTATATPDMRDEIILRLRLRDPEVVTSSFDRPNIFFRVDHYRTEDEKMEALIRMASWAEKPGIVYVAARKTAEKIVEALDEQGIEALYYHGGLSRKDRDAVQEHFMSGTSAVMVATNAFGMGVDKADVRFVYHFDICASLEAYYQELGRGGRDGEKSEAVLLYRNENLGIQKFRTALGKMEADEIAKVAKVVEQSSEPVLITELSEELELPERKIEAYVQRLADVGAIEVKVSGEVLAIDDSDIECAPEQAAAAHEIDEEQRLEKLQQMRDYAEAKTCRREILLNYLGEEFEGPCGNCDNCLAAAKPDQTSSVGTRREVV